MTFLTPTLLAGDRSLVDVVAHELAHSWTGNLVTNADMEHFWLNEGFTVWAERRLLEALHGRRGRRPRLGDRREGARGIALPLRPADSPLTRLRTELAGHRPGRRFLVDPLREGLRAAWSLLERAHGPPPLRPLHARVHDALPLHLDHDRGVPDLPRRAAAGGRGRGRRPRLAVRAGHPGERAGLPLRRARTRWWPSPPRFESGARPTRGRERRLEHRPRRSSTCRTCRGRSDARGLRLARPRALRSPTWGNYEILVEWLTVAAGSDYEPAFARLREVLMSVGRMKYLRPLYGALAATPRTRALAARCSPPPPRATTSSRGASRHPSSPATLTTVPARRRIVGYSSRRSDPD